MIAAGAFLAGVAIWGTIAFTGANVIGDAVKDLDFNPSGPAAIDCGADPEGFSLEQRVRYQEECPTPTLVATATPVATPTPVNNRLDCDEIRGTDYLSRGERTWFLDNCVNS